MAARFLEQSPFCPIPLYELGSPVATDYSVPNFRAEPFAISLEYWMQRRTSYYFQKWQTEDPICIQFHLPTLGPGVVSVDIVTCAGELRSNVPLDQMFTAPGNVINGTLLTTYQYKWRYSELTYNGQALPVGRYLVRVTVNYDDVAKYYISEPQEVAAFYPDTVPIDYSHDENEHRTIFSLSPNFRLRVEGQILYNNVKYTDNTYTTQGNETDLLDSKTADEYQLTVGSKRKFDSNPGIPRWLMQIICKAFSLRYSAVKGRLYTRPNGEEMEITTRTPTDLQTGVLLLEAKESNQDLVLGIADLYITNIPATYPFAITPLTISNGPNTVILAGGVPREVTNVTTLNQILGLLNATPNLLGTFIVDNGALYYRNGPMERYINATGETYDKRMLFRIGTGVGQSFQYRYNGGQHVVVWNGTDTRVATSTAGLPANTLATQTKTNLPQNSNANTLSIYHKDNIFRLNFPTPISAASLFDLPAAYSKNLTHLTINGQFVLLKFDLKTLVSVADSLRELRMNDNAINEIVGPGWDTGLLKKFANLTYVDFRDNQIPTTPDQETLLVDFVQNASYAHPGTWLMEGQGNGPASGAVVQNANFMTSAGWQVSYDL